MSLQIRRRADDSYAAHSDKPAYYGKNIVKPHVWTPMIPTYFAIGGMAGASATLGWLARLRGNRQLARAGFRTAFAGAAVSGVLLVADLGVPKRFLNMLRMFKPTSPMSMGTWIIQAVGAGATVAVASEVFGDAIPPALVRSSEAIAGLFGLPMAVYTAVLIADTATPSWFEARNHLPFLFMAGAASSAGAANTLLSGERSGRSARFLAIAGGALEIAMHHRMTQALGSLGDPYRQGKAHRLSRAATACTAGGCALLALCSKAAPARVAGSLLLLAGAVLERFCVLEAGSESARNPRYVLAQQHDQGAFNGTALKTTV